MRRQLSIRARITIGSLIVAALVFTVALAVVRGQVGVILEQADVTLARNDLTSFAVDIATSSAEGVDEPAAGLLVSVTSPSGDTQIDTLPPQIHEVVENRDAGDEQFDVEVDDARFVVVGRTVETPEGTWTLWAARSTEASALALRSLDSLFVIGGALLLLTFGAASWLLVSAALRPVVRLQRGAERLAGADDRATLPVGAADDEISKLATTLNAFLAEVRNSADREKQMVSDAAHELRTPLAALKTQLEIAREDSADPHLSAQLATAESAVDRLSDLATNLLELARLDQLHTLDHRATPGEVAAEFLSAIDRARLLALRRGIEVDFELGDLGATVATSAASFARICDNLLANAVAAASAGVTARLREQDGTLLFSVADDGAGMPEEFIGRAFERFSRSDSSRSTTGSGLGLSLVHAIVSAAGGSVSLHNTDPGFEARVVLPIM